MKLAEAIDLSKSIYDELDPVMVETKPIPVASVSLVVVYADGSKITNTFGTEPKKRKRKGGG